MKLTKSLIGCIFIASSLMFSSCAGGVKDKDGNIYKIGKRGNKEWMAENLNVSRFRNGETIPEVKSAGEWERSGKEGKPAWCIQKNDPENGKRYGKLYNWYAVNDPRGLAPKGWHVASDEEWKQLTDYFGGEIFAAYKMRTLGVSETGTGTSVSGFSGLPAGACTSNGSFFGLGSHGFWWTATELTVSNSWIRLLNYINCSVNSLNYNKLFGLSVRCLRD